MQRSQMIALARELRKNQTPEENIVWQNVRNRKLAGKKFLRQHPIVYAQVDDKASFFIADFYCHEYKLIVEIDGDIHDLQKDEDYQRDLILKEMGLRILRIKNEEVNNNIQLVLQKISDELT